MIHHKSCPRHLVGRGGLGGRAWGTGTGTGGVPACGEGQTSRRGIKITTSDGGKRRRAEDVHSPSVLGPALPYPESCHCFSWGCRSVPPVRLLRFCHSDGGVVAVCRPRTTTPRDWAPLWAATFITEGSDRGGCFSAAVTMSASQGYGGWVENWESRWSRQRRQLEAGSFDGGGGSHARGSIAVT